MNKEENNGHACNSPDCDHKNAIEVRCNERSSKIIKEVFLHDPKDPFNRASMMAVKSSGVRNLPINVSLAGSAEEGRVSIVSNAICSMITIELDDENGQMYGNALACISEFDKDGKQLDLRESEGRTLLQLSLNNSNLHTIIGAIMMAQGPAFAQGCEMIVNQFGIDPDQEDPEVAPEGESPIPFPGSEPAPVN